MHRVTVITLRISIKSFLSLPIVVYAVYTCHRDINHAYRIYPGSTHHNRHARGALNRFIKQGMNGCGSVIKGIDVDCGVDS